MSDKGLIGISSKPDRSPSIPFIFNTFSEKPSRSPSIPFIFNTFSEKPSRSPTAFIPFQFAGGNYVLGERLLTLRLTSSVLPAVFTSMTLNTTYGVVGGEDLIQGTPNSPCLRMDSAGKWRFRAIFKLGVRTISVSVKQTINMSPRPSMVIKNNPNIGLNDDIITVAPSGTDWVTIGPIFVSPSSTGAVWIELRNNYVTQYAQCPCYWDNIQTT